MELRSITFKDDVLFVLDQLKLPFEKVYIECKNYQDVIKVIKNMNTRGAPLIGVSAAYGLYLGALFLLSKTTSKEEFIISLNKISLEIKGSRPTAVNLFNAIDRLLSVASKNKTLSIEKITNLLKEEAVKMEKEDEEQNFLIGKFGSSLIKKNEKILTICNTGNLATVKYGTAFAAISFAHKDGKNIFVYALETRPYLQGARLTAFELIEEEIPFSLITDSMAGTLMAQKKVDIIIVGADRITLNGDFANKIGTFQLAVLAKYHSLPFYVAAPVSSFDFKSKNGSEIMIEERNEEEVTHCLGKRIAPLGVKAYNPSFDITPAQLVSGIITDKGIIYPPFEDSIKNL